MPKAAKTAQNKLMDYLSRRDHSEKELRTKLRTHEFSEAEIDGAIATAKESGWMSPPEELAERVYLRLNEKGKGALYIQRYLAEKGLPDVHIDEDIELEKGRKLIEPLIERGEDREKQQRYLTNRGYAPKTIRKVLHEKY